MENYEIIDSCDTKCPNCKHEQDYVGDALSEDEETEVECDNCGEEYLVMKLVSTSHKCYKKK